MDGQSNLKRPKVKCTCVYLSGLMQFITIQHAGIMTIFMIITSTVTGYPRNPSQSISYLQTKVIEQPLGISYNKPRRGQRYGPINQHLGEKPVTDLLYILLPCVTSLK